MLLHNVWQGGTLKSALVRILGHRATLIHGDTLVLDRWHWLKRYLKAVPPGSRSLIDVGCGTGAFTIGTARMGYRSLGLSWDKRNQAAAAERAAICHADLAKFEVQDVRGLGSREDLKGQFDVAICLECIEHILDDQKLMVDVAGCLRPGGQLLLTTPNVCFRPISRTDENISPVEDGGHVRRGYSPEDLERICHAAGFGVERIEYCSGVLSQKLTGILRSVSRQTTPMLGWGVVLPFRWIPPLFDKMATTATKWPHYCIALVARKGSQPVENSKTS